ncbi:MAG: ATP-binding protein [candidate division FCPU426 bacterium]
MLFSNPYGIPVLLSGLLVLGVAIYSLRSTNRINKAFGFIGISLSLYLLGMLPYYYPLYLSWTPLFKIPFLGSISLPLAFFYFTLVFLGELPRLRILLYCAICIDAFVILSAEFNLGFCRDNKTFFFGEYMQFAGMGYFFTAFFIALYFLSLALLYRAYRQATWQTHRRRLLFILLGFSLIILGSVDFVPTFGLEIYPFGWLIAAVAMGFLAYALFVFRVAEVEATVIKIGTWIMALLAVTIPYIALVWLYLKMYNSFSFSSLFWHLCGSFILMASLLPIIRRWLRARQTAYVMVLERVLKEIASLQNPLKLVQSIRTTLESTLAVESVTIIIRENIRNQYYAYLADGSRHEAPPILIPFLPYLSTHPRTLLRYDVTLDPNYAAIRPLALPAFEALHAQLFLPLVKGDMLMGLISFGEKKNQGILQASELEFLARLQPLAAIALNNAYFYNHIQQLNQALLETNQSLNARVKARTQELEIALDETKRLNEEQSRFFELASHNLGTPFTAVKVAFMILKKQFPDLETDLYDIIYKNLLRLELLIQNILLISLAENNRLQLDIVPIPIEKTVLDTFAKVRALYPEMDVDFEFNGDPELVFINGDYMRIRTVLFNLLSNAMKYSESPASIQIQVRKLVRPSPEYDSGIGGHSFPRHFAEIIIADHGEGIGAEELKYIFQKFNQTNNRKQYTGHGLGLHLAKKIIEYHGGRMRVTSTPGKGSTFAFCLPLHPENYEPPESLETREIISNLPLAIMRELHSELDQNKGNP